MICIEIAAPGSPDVLRPVERPDPVPAAGEVLIRVAAAGVNRPDVMQRQGLYPPPPGASDIPGLEVAGIIESIADDVADDISWLARRRRGVRAGVGRRLCRRNAWRPASSACRCRRRSTLVAAAAIPETFFTVWTNVFDRGRLQAGESALFHGGASGIGTTAIQLAAARGVRVFATAGSTRSAAPASGSAPSAPSTTGPRTSLQVVRELTGDRGVDVILDIVGGSYVNRNLAALAMDGRLSSSASWKGRRKPRSTCGGFSGDG